MKPDPILIFGYGNPGRGDDALGPEFISAINKLKLPGVECLSDMQLQIEHVTDLLDRKLLIFVDADASSPSPCHMEQLSAAKDESYTSHAMTPGALLYAYQQVYHRKPPASQLLHIRGYQFELGETLSEQAQHNLDTAIELIRKQCRLHKENEAATIRN